VIHRVWPGRVLQIFETICRGQDFDGAGRIMLGHYEEFLAVHTRQTVVADNDVEWVLPDGLHGLFSGGNDLRVE
jgi:hypothetical protein